MLSESKRESNYPEDVSQAYKYLHVKMEYWVWLTMTTRGKEVLRECSLNPFFFTLTFLGHLLTLLQHRFRGEHIMTYNALLSQPLKSPKSDTATRTPKDPLNIFHQDYLPSMANRTDGVTPMKRIWMAFQLPSSRRDFTQPGSVRTGPYCPSNCGKPALDYQTLIGRDLCHVPPCGSVPVVKLKELAECRSQFVPWSVKRMHASPCLSWPHTIISPMPPSDHFLPINI